MEERLSVTASAKHQMKRIRKLLKQGPLLFAPGNDTGATSVYQRRFGRRANFTFTYVLCALPKAVLLGLPGNADSVFGAREGVEGARIVGVGVGRFQDLFGLDLCLLGAGNVDFRGAFGGLG